MMYPIVSHTDFPGLRLLGRGKVRDIYDFGERLLIVATDRLSAFDAVLPTPIPDKGRVLTQLSLFWFEMLRGVIPNHVISGTEFPEEARAFAPLLKGRSMVALRTEPVPIECVVRGYLSGSGWKEYQDTGAVCGIALPKNLRESERLPEAIFTPSTKATSGHDENISFEETVERVGRPLAESLRDVSLEIYRRGAEYARPRGIILADTKFEFGVRDGQLMWIDEALTPDSSRFWPASEYAPGRAQPSFDKQFVRNYLEKIGWTKQPPAPELPRDVVSATRAKYREAYERITGRTLE